MSTRTEDEHPCGCPINSFGQVTCEERTGFTGSYCVWERCCEERAAEDREREVCKHCGKEFEEFGDLGCSACDRRHPNFGVMP